MDGFVPRDLRRSDELDGMIPPFVARAFFRRRFVGSAGDFTEGLPAPVAEFCMRLARSETGLLALEQAQRKDKCDC